MKKIVDKINIWPILLAAIAILLCALNYTPDTWLSGWDTLHPEFNLVLYLKRIFFGVWQEHQGLGALAVQAQASEIPRMIFAYPLSLIFPDNFLRYSYLFLTLIVGCLGMFYFLQGVIFKDIKENIRNLASFSGGLFYLLNLGTLQQFHLPLEMFATHFASLPWLFLFAFRFLKKGRSKDLLTFLAATFFASPMAHTPTLFYAYLLGLIVFLFGYFIQDRKLLKKCLVIFWLTIVTNFFWFLPHLYFIFTSGNIVQESKISSMFSNTAFLTGQKFGNLKDTLFLKNYLFEWGKYDNASNQFIRLFGEWNLHLARIEIIIIQYLIAGMVLIGLFWSIKNKKNKNLSILGIFLMSFLLIANEAPLLKNLYIFLQSKIPLFKEALRFPYTKFSILLIFSQAVFFGVFWEKITEKVFKNLKAIKEREKIIYLTIFVSILLVCFMLPAFKGNLFNKDMKVKFPPEYFSAMEYLNNQKSGRIALFPIPQYWGWIYHDWGYEGAGFEWFGLKNPLLDREFDRWNPYNEQFYWELSYAVYSKNLSLLEDVLKKYQVKWLLLDESAINPASPKAIFTDELKEMFLKSEKIVLTQALEKIKIYKFNSETQTKDFVFLTEALPIVNEYKWGNSDQAYNEIGDYISDSTSSLDAFYPFRSLFTGRKINELNIEIEDLGDEIVFKAQLPEGLENYSIQTPKDYEGKELVKIDSTTYDTQYFLPTINSDGKTISINFPKISGLLSAEIDPSIQGLQAVNCNQFNKGMVSLQNRLGLIEIQAEDANNCGASFYLSNLSHKHAYLISGEAKNISGQSLLFWLENLTNRKADLELYLSKTESQFYLIQPPMAQDGLGYTLHFDNISIGKEKSVNELGKVSVNLIPYEFLTKIKLVQSTENKGQRSEDKEQGETEMRIESVKHSNPSVYVIEIKTSFGDTTLVLSQAYHKGWKAFALNKQYAIRNTNLINFLAPVLGKEIKEHVLVNNWENGWLLPDNFEGKIILVFLPQYLEYLGFGFLGITVLVLIFRLRR